MKKPFQIEQKINPTDNWTIKKRFADRATAEQSLATLRKNVPNFFKKSKYFQYRLIEKFEEMTAENWMKDFCQRSGLTPKAAEKRLAAFSKKRQALINEQQKNKST